jgi:iron complex outermembrane recepter protein
VGVTGNETAIAGEPMVAALAPSAGIDGPNGAGSLDEVVVTAQKRSENLKDVPISISVISGDEIAAAQIADYDDLSRSVPGLSFGSGGQEGLTNIEIRGVSSASGSATVGVYLDDVSMTVKNFFDGATQPKLFDLDRIEILRGPQGTLWGASSMGGTIRFVSRQPDLTAFSAEVGSDVSYTERGSANGGANFVVNAPIIDNELGFRMSGGYRYDSGWINNYSSTGQLQSRGTNYERAYEIRPTMKYVPNDKLTITATVFLQQDRTGDTSVFDTSLPLFDQNKEVREPSFDRLLLPSLTIQANLGAVDFTAVSGYFERTFNRTEDGTYYNDTVFAQAFLDPIYPGYKAQNDSLIGNLPSPVQSLSTYTQFSQEFRVSSPVSAGAQSPLKWVAGLYYADQVERNKNIETSPGINRLFQAIYGVPMEQSLVETYYGAPGLILFPNDNNGSAIQRYEEKQFAAFGQADFDILRSLHGSVGLRYTSARVNYDYSSYGFYDIGEVSPYSYSADFSNTTPKFGLSYDVSGESSAYATISKGTRLGGPSRPVPFGAGTVCAQDFANLGVATQPVAFKSDSLWNYELGSKNRFLDNRLSVDASIYFIKWSDIQQQIYLPICGFSYTSNVGNAKSYGSELEVRYKATKGLTLGLTGSSNRSTITSSNNIETVQVGEHVLNVPDWTYTLDATYSWAVFDRANAFVRTDYDWVGGSYGSYVRANSDYYDPSYGVLNATVGFGTDRWSVSLFGKNLANNQTIIQRPQINTVIEGYTVRPLTVGLSAKYKFE